MPSRSKWQSLPTEQINPATLAIDKLAPADIVEGMLNEDRKMLAADPQHSPLVLSLQEAKPTKLLGFYDGGGKGLLTKLCVTH